MMTTLLITHISGTSPDVLMIIEEYPMFGEAGIRQQFVGNAL